MTTTASAAQPATDTAPLPHHTDPRHGRWFIRELERGVRRTTELANLLTNPELGPWLAAVDRERSGLDDRERVRLAFLALRAHHRETDTP